ARQAAEENNRHTQRTLAAQKYGGGQTEGERGETGQALLWLDSALKDAIAAGDRDLERAIRTNLAAWRAPLHALSACLRHEHDGEVEAVAFSPDGQLALTGGEDGWLWMGGGACGPGGGPPGGAPGGPQQARQGARVQPRRPLRRLRRRGRRRSRLGNRDGGRDARRGPQGRGALRGLLAGRPARRLRRRRRDGAGLGRPHRRAGSLLQ